MNVIGILIMYFAVHWFFDFINDTYKYVEYVVQ